MKVVFLDASTVDAGDVDFSSLATIAEWEKFPQTKPEEVLERLAGATVAIVNKVRLSGEQLRLCSEHLRLVAISATGTNNVDLEAAKTLGIQVCNVAGYSTESVAQHTLAQMLNLVTHVNRYAAEPAVWANSPIFTRLDYPVRELKGMTLGLVGTGSIGERVGSLAEAFGMTVHAYARPGANQNKARWPRTSGPAFFAKSAVVSLHCPLTAETHGFIGESALAAMPSGSFLINTGRGELVDESALIDALQSGHLAGAALDVLSQEPPPADHPLLRYKHPRLLITPHTAWSSREARQRLIERVAKNIQAFGETGEATSRVA